MSTPTFKFGSSKPVSRIGFGTMGMSIDFYGAIPDSDEERFEVLDAAYNEGSWYWDTADMYGDSEDLLGKWFKRNPEKRKDIFLATKFGFAADGSIRGDPAFVKEQSARSLKRLGVDYIDLYYQHRVDPKTPIEITVRAMAELQRDGKIKHLGLSECTAKDFRRAYAAHPISALQVEYSPFVLDIEKNGILDAARELGVAIVAYSPLSKGLVTGNYKSPKDFAEDDLRRILPKFSEANFPKILDVAKRLKEIADARNATPGQVTLAWILEQGDFIVIPGTKKIKYLKENVGASKVKLSPEEVATVRKIAEAGDLPGTRYQEGVMAYSLVESPPLKE